MTTVVIGAGLAGLVTASVLHDAGRDVLVLDGNDAPGGTSLLSSGFFWRYRTIDGARRDAPGGDARLQQLLADDFSAALDWLSARSGASPVPGQSNVRTEAVRLPMQTVIDGLVEALPPHAVRCSVLVTGVEPAAPATGRWMITTANGERIQTDAVVFAGGGYGANLDLVARCIGAAPAARRHWQLRNAGTAWGSARETIPGLGGSLVPVTGRCFARLMPAGRELDMAHAAEHALIFGEHGVLLADDGTIIERAAHDWSDTVLANDLMRRCGRGWLCVAGEALEAETVHGRIGDIIRSVADAGCAVIEASANRPLEAWARDRWRDDLAAAVLDVIAQSACIVPVVPGITHTLDGVSVDVHARVRTHAHSAVAARTHEGAPAHDHVPGLYAVGCDVGGVAGDGYTSGLLQALVLGRAAAHHLIASPQ